MAGCINTKARINASRNISWTRLQLFEIFLPKEYIQEILLYETYKKINGALLLYGEFLQWMGIQFVMATQQGFQRQDFWSIQKINTFITAPVQFNGIMTQNHFKEILKALSYACDNPPSYKDPFWEIRQMIEAWNENMRENFTPSWISFLDESMMKWINRYTCPGFMFVPRKPWPFGNEFHTIACSETGILYAMEIVEGKDKPPEVKKEFAEFGKTTLLMLRLTRSLWGTGKVVVLDSRFCVLRGIIKFKKRYILSCIDQKMPILAKITLMVIVSRHISMTSQLGMSIRFKAHWTTSLSPCLG